MDEAPLDARPPDAAPFRHDGGPLGVLLVHGFTGTPFEMRPLGEELAARGYTVLAPRLAGHAASVEELARSRHGDWLATAARALDELTARTERRAVVGLSMGGLCALHLAHAHPDTVHAVAALATPLWLVPWQARAVRLLARLPSVPALPKLGRSDIADGEMRLRNPSAQRMPIAPVASLLDLADATRALLPSIKQPAFLAHSRLDHTVPYECLDELRRKIGSRSVETLTLEKSFHVITIDVERELLAARIDGFLRRTLETH